ncbi:MAG TPA: thymidine kinase [Fimbriimonadaceae bacterium]|nr:thymidine kinase [Fimbriimonadaceae bacterium]
MSHQSSTITHQKRGSLTVVTGSMFAGKSEELIRLARRALYARKKVQVFKPSVDTRYDDAMVVTHMGVKHDALPVQNVKELAAKIEADTDVLFIEEAQFFDDSLVPLVVGLADKGREVICAGLDQDFRREPFGPMPKLLAVADNVVKLRAICMRCGAVASHAFRTVDGKPAGLGDPIVLIGATERYEALCRDCYVQLYRKTRRKK